MFFQIILVGVIGYLVGSIQFARLVATANGVDLERTGSGVASVANLRHTVGTRWAGVATIGDVVKTLLPVSLSNMLADPDWAAYIAVCAVAGHNWPVFSNFNGGRGMLAAIAAAAVLIPGELFVLAAILLPIALRMRDTAPNSLVALLLFPVAAALVGEPRSVVIAFIAIAYIMVIRRLTAPPRGKLSLKTLASKLIFDRPDPSKHWALEGEEGERRVP